MSISLGYVTENGVSGSQGNSGFKLLRNYQQFSKWLHRFQFPQQRVKVLTFLHPCRHSLLPFWLQPSQGRGGSLTVAVIHISTRAHDAGMFGYSFSCAVGHLCIFFGKMSFQILYLFLNCFMAYFIAELQEFFIYIYYKNMICKYFLPVYELSFIFLCLLRHKT